MAERATANNIRHTLFRLMGIPQPHSIDKLDRKLNQLEKHLKDWAKKVEKAKHVAPKEVLEEAHVKPKRVVLVDTETGNFDLIKETLPEGLDLRMVKDWEQLFREMKKADVSLVIMDLTVLGPEGAKNIKKLRDYNPEVKVVALASYLSEALAQAMPDGMDFSAILQKPLNPFQLKEDLVRHLPSA